METYQTEQALALARERQHHIAAAARQLETLRLFEERQSNDNVTTLNYDVQINENYVGLQGQTDEIRKSEKKGDIKGEKIVHFKEDTTMSPGVIVPPGEKKKPENSIAASVLHYADIGLSTELQSILNRSTLDPANSFLGNELEKSLYQLDERKKFVSSQYDEKSREEQLQKQVSKRHGKLPSIVIFQQSY